jgi:hypothetical protein
MPSKPRLIIKPPEHVHQTPLFKLNKCSKTLYNLSNLGVGGVSRHPIGSINPQVKGVSQGKPIQAMCEYEVDGVRLLGMGFMTYKGLYCLIYVRFVKGVLSFVCDATLFQAHLLPLIN